MSEKIGRGNNKPAHTKKTIERVMQVEPNDFNSLSLEFTLTCIRAHISLHDAADFLGVTRGAVYRWSKGCKIREERRPKVRVFMQKLKDDTERGILPKLNRVATANYIRMLREQPQ